MATFHWNTTLNTPHLIGRALEFEALQNLLIEVKKGRGQCVLLSGEAGVGKSRLTGEFRQEAEQAAWLVLQGNALDYEITRPYAPLTDSLRRFLNHPPTAEAASAFKPFASALANLLPELSLTLPDIQPTSELSPELEKRHLFEVLVQFFIQLATDRPLLIIIEDIHWADETSLEFLQLLAHRLQSLPIFLLLTTRLQSESPPFNHFLTQLNRQRLAQEIRLQLLSEAAVEAMLRSIFGWEQTLKLPLLKAIYTLTEGNPFFVEEVASALVDAGDIFYQNDRWHIKTSTRLTIPHSLRLIVRQHTAQLSAGAKELLALAAVAGRNFDFEVLARLTDHNETELLALIKELVAARLVVEESADTFTFRHALTREAIYDGLLTRERRRRHQAIATFYEQKADDQYLSHLSYHFYESETWEKVLEYGQAAGRQALARFAPHAALTHFARAATAAGQLARSLPLDVLQQRGQAHQMVGDFDAARQDFESLLAMAQANQDQQAEWQALHDLGFLWMARDYARMGQYLQPALALARRLNDPTRLAQSLNRLGNWEANIGQPLAAIARHEEALTIFEAQQDQHGLAVTLDLIGTVHGITGNMAASEANYQRAIPLFEALGDRQALASCLAMLARSGFVTEGERALEIAREIGWRDGEANAHIRLAFVHIERGEFDVGLNHARQGLEIAQEIDHTFWQIAAFLGLGSAHGLMLALEAAEQVLTQALNLAKSSGAEVWASGIYYRLALARLNAGDVDGAADLLSSATMPPDALEIFGHRSMALARGEVALAQQQPETTLAMVEAVLTALPDLRTWRDHTLPEFRYLQGRTLLALGRLDEAVTALAEALELCRLSGLRAVQWRVQADLARVHLEQKERPAAESLLRQAEQLIEELVETMPTADLRGQFRQAAQAYLPPLPELTALQQAKQAFAGLTRRERQVAALVAEGKSNQEIADELVITVRTTKTHITNILTKLDFTSRTQIAAWVVETDLLDKN